MLRRAALLLVAFVLAPVSAFAQLTPPADPSGIGNASNVPPLRANPPPSAASSSSVDQPAPRARVVAPPYAGASPRITSARQGYPRKPPIRRRGRPEVSGFTGICRGC